MIYSATSQDVEAVRKMYISAIEKKIAIKCMPNSYDFYEEIQLFKTILSLDMSPKAVKRLRKTIESIYDAN